MFRLLRSLPLVALAPILLAVCVGGCASSEPTAKVMPFDATAARAFTDQLEALPFANRPAFVQSHLNDVANLQKGDQALRDRFQHLLQSP